MKKLTSLSIFFFFTLTIFAQATKWDLNGNNPGSNDFIGTTNNQALVFKTDNTVRMKISPTGNIIIKDLESTGGGLVKANDNGKLGKVDYPNNSQYILDGTGSFVNINTLTGWNVNSNLVTLNSGGKVGIGISNPTHNLDVLGTVNIDGFLHVDSIQVGDSSIYITSDFTPSIPPEETEGNHIYAKTLGGGPIDKALQINCLLASPNTYINAKHGKVGIGTKKPLGMLTIKDGTNYNLTISQNIGFGSGMILKCHNDLNSTNGEMAFDAGQFVFQNGPVKIGNNIATVSGAYAAGKYALYVEYGILAERVKVAVHSTLDWSDYVFANNYQLLSLDSVENYILKNKHLQGIPGSEEMVANGNDLGQTDKLLLEKIENLYLYVIELNKEVQLLKTQNELLMKQNETFNSQENENK